MRRRRMTWLGLTAAVVLAMAVAYTSGWRHGQASEVFNLLSQAQAAGGRVTNARGTAPGRYVYYPGTEALAED